MEFAWDLSKEIENIKKHKVTFYEAVETFSDKKGFVLEDIRHSDFEKRLFWIGKTFVGRILTTRFTKRVNVIRIIGSAEWRKFRRIYNETTKAR